MSHEVPRTTQGEERGIDETVLKGAGNGNISDNHCSSCGWMA
jgi:hypothetical protein